MREKNSPSEHRSKYFNDVFSSSVNLGPTNKTNDQESLHRIVKQIEMGGRVHYSPKNQLSSTLVGKLL